MKPYVTPKGLSAALALLLLLANVSVAHAEESGTGDAVTGERDSAWRWRRHHAADYVATGVFGATALITELVPRRHDDHWVGGNPFDLAFRDAFVQRSYGGRQAIGLISDITLSALVIHRLVIDNALVTWAGEGDGDTAWQRTALDLQAMMFTLAATGASKRAFERERPSGRACRTEAGYDRRCEQADNQGSFWSGHTSLAFTSASLTCTHHLNAPIYGGSADAVACVAAMFAASSVAFERIAADRHYATDVFTGAAVGVLSGALLPWVSFYSRPDDEDANVPLWSLTPAPFSSGAGLSMQGLF